MSPSQRPDRVLPDEPTHRPLERFWPYAELPEQPSDEELAALDPQLRDVLFGARTLPFSITIVFPRFDDPRYAQAIACARESDEYLVTGTGPALRHRARFFPADRPLRLRNLYEKVGHLSEAEVLIDDRPVPYARQLWLPLVWMLIR
jgi:hypothetical protein